VDRSYSAIRNWIGWGPGCALPFAPEPSPYRTTRSVGPIWWRRLWTRVISKNLSIHYLSAPSLRKLLQWLTRSDGLISNGRANFGRKGMRNCKCNGWLELVKGKRNQQEFGEVKRRFSLRQKEYAARKGMLEGEESQCPICFSLSVRDCQHSIQQL